MLRNERSTEPESINQASLTLVRGVEDAGKCEETQQDDSSPGVSFREEQLTLSNSDRPCLVDAADVHRHCLTKWVWRLSTDGYPSRATRIDGKRAVVKIHRLVANAKPGQVVDHINGDRLDNRRQNLRLTDNQGNARNVRKPGRLKGVSWNVRGKKWEAAIGAGQRKPNGKARRLYLGLFADRNHAAQTYDRAALYYFGEFASLNFPELRDAYLAQLTWDGIASTPLGCRPEQLVAGGAG